MYSMSIKEGQDYNKLKKGIVILICDFEIKKLKKIPKYITKWNIREEEYHQKILTDVLEIYIIEMPKFEKYKQDVKNEELNLWMKFIKNPEVVEMNENEEIKDTIQAINEAKKVLEEISQDEKEQYLAELRLKHILDTKAIKEGAYEEGREEGLEKGIEEGKKEGIKEGIKEGKEEQTLIIAKRMKEEDLSIDMIMNITGLSKEKIEKL